MRPMSRMLMLLRWSMCMWAPLAAASDTISSTASNDDCGSITLMYRTCVKVGTP